MYVFEITLPLVRLTIIFPLQKDICPSLSDKFPFYRAYQPVYVNHFYTMYEWEWRGTSAIGYNLEGIVGYVFAIQQLYTIPLHRLFNPNRVDHFYTTNEAEAISATTIGWVREGVAGYVFYGQLCGSQPLFRLYNPVSVDHFYTTNVAERDNVLKSGHYVDEGVAGYILV